MKMKLKRYNFGAKATLGKLYVDDSFFCYTLEDKYREIDGMAVEMWKVQNNTAIPKGKYEVIIDYSGHFNRELPHLLNVPGYTGVRIHPGNDDGDTEGCILVGGNVVNDDYISNSRVTFDHLFDMMEHAYVRAEPITIEVS